MVSMGATVAPPPAKLTATMDRLSPRGDALGLGARLLHFDVFTDEMLKRPRLPPGEEEEPLSGRLDPQVVAGSSGSSYPNPSTPPKISLLSRCLIAETAGERARALPWPFERTLPRLELFGRLGPAGVGLGRVPSRPSFLPRSEPSEYALGVAAEDESGRRGAPTGRGRRRRRRRRQVRSRRIRRRGWCRWRRGWYDVGAGAQRRRRLGLRGCPPPPQEGGMGADRSTQ